MNKAHEIAQNNLIGSKIKSKKINTNIKFKIGDLVYVKNEISRPRHCKKLISNYSGPYKIISIDSNVNCTIIIRNKKVKVHMNRLKLAHIRLK